MMREFAPVRNTQSNSSQSETPIARSFFPPSFRQSTPEKESIDKDGHHQEPKDNSARFQGDPILRDIFKGTEVLSLGAKGIKVTKLQQALVDMGYSLPKYGVDGDFGTELEAALKKFQKDTGVPDSGKFDKATIAALDSRFDTRSDYLQAASKYDPADPKAGTRTLSATDKTAAVAALSPKSAGGASAKFTPTIGARNYGDEIKNRLTTEIARLHKEKYEDMLPLRADPVKNFHKDADLEGAANAGKDATDLVYGNLNKGPDFVMKTNLLDQWEDEESLNGKKTDAERKDKAAVKMMYYIDAQCDDINTEFNADTGAVEELKILNPIIESFIDTPAKAQIVLDIETGWSGAQLDGKQYLQLFKDQNDEVNRRRMWKLFHTSIHEYIHTLRDKKYTDWAKSLGGSKKHTLIEGFCDFFTLNVRAKYDKSALKAFQKKVEGSFYNAAAPEPIPDFDGGVYGSNAEAERMVGIIGINNAQLGYFKGEVELMGKV